MIAGILTITGIITALTAVAAWSGNVFIAALAAVILLFCILDILLNLLASRKISADILVSEDSPAENDIPVNIHVRNNSHIPVFRGRIRVTVENRNFGFHKTEKLNFSVFGKEERNLSFAVHSDFCGNYLIRIQEIRSFGLLGVFGFRAAGDLDASAFLFPQWSYIGGVSEALRTNYEKEKRFAGRKSSILSDLLQYREYQKGDSLKNVNWKLTAKMGDLIVRDFDTPVDNQILIVSDIQREDAGCRNISYNVLFSICMTFLRNNIAFQLGFMEGSRISFSQVDDMKSLFRTMRDLLSAFDDGGISAADILEAYENLNKYARVLYVTDGINPKVEYRMRRYANLEMINVSENRFHWESWKEEIKKLAV